MKMTGLSEMLAIQMLDGERRDRSEIGQTMPYRIVRQKNGNAGGGGWIDDRVCGIYRRLLQTAKGQPAKVVIAHQGREANSQTQHGGIMGDDRRGTAKRRDKASSQQIPVCLHDQGKAIQNQVQVQLACYDQIKRLFGLERRCFHSASQRGGFPRLLM